MQKIKLPLIVIIILVQLSCKTNNTKQMPFDTSIFPKAKSNQTQHIIQLPKDDNESNCRVEIFITKNMLVDCNIHNLQGEIKTHDLEGWGYDYYTFETKGEITSTLMACPDDKKTQQDVASQSKLLNYNSKIPIIIYTPKGYKAKYKIWRAEKDIHTAKQSTNTEN